MTPRSSRVASQIFALAFLALLDGAIHRAAGPELLDECRTLGGCPTGEARITKGYRLPAKFVIHTVGPVWHGGTRGEPELLARCYRSSLVLVRDAGLRTVAFASISTGAYRYPMALAARVALREIDSILASDTQLERVVLVCYDARARAVHEDARRELGI